MIQKNSIIRGLVLDRTAFTSLDALVWDGGATHNDSHVECFEPIVGFSSKLSCFRFYQSLRPSVIAFVRGSVVGDEGAVIDHRRRLYKPSVEGPTRTLLSAPSFRITEGNAQFIEVDGTAGVVLHRGPRNFGHFMGDGIGRIWQLIQCGESIDWWIIPDDTPQWYLDFLNLFGIDPKKTLKASPNSVICASRILIPSASGFAAFTAPWLKRAHEDLVTLPRDSRSESRIWVSRSEQRRCWIFEQEARNEIEKRGFEFVEPEKLSVKRQIQKFCSASVVAGPHGSGLNWCFSSRQTHGLIFEVSNPELVHLDFYTAAGMLKWRYARTPAEVVDPVADPANSIIRVSADSVLRTLDFVLDQWSGGR
jgi:hypothetical protein